MRRTLFTAAGAALAVAVVAGWHWWAGPTVYLLPGADEHSLWAAVGDAPAAGPAARWLVMRQHDAGLFWVLDHDTGRLTGPWPGPPSGDFIVVDPAGRVYFHPPGHVAGRLAVRRYDFARRAADEVWAREDGHEWIVCGEAAGGPALAVASIGPGRPLRVEVVDLFTGAVLSGLDFPDRPGRVKRWDGAAHWAVSADGTRLVFGERLRPGGPDGLELWDILTGHRIATLDTGGRSAGDPEFTRVGSTPAVTSYTYPPVRPAPDGDGPARLWWDTDSGCRLTEPPPPFPGAVLVARGGDLMLWRAPPVPGVERLRVTTADGTPTADWVTLPAGWVGLPEVSVMQVEAKFVPGTTGVVLAGDDRTPAAGWQRWLHRQLGLRDPGRVVGATWYDWRAGTVRRLWSRPLGIGSTYAVAQSGRLTVVTSDLTAGRYWLRVWPTPPRPAPPLWLWPLGLAAGGLAGWTVRRRPPSPRAGTASTGSS